MKKILKYISSIMLILLLGGIMSLGVFALNDNKKVYADADTVTDLAGTTWTFNELCSSNVDASYTFENLSFTFSFDDTVFSYLKLSYVGPGRVCFFASTTSSFLGVSSGLGVFNYFNSSSHNNLSFTVATSFSISDTGSDSFSRQIFYYFDFDLPDTRSNFYLSSSGLKYDGIDSGTFFPIDFSTFNNNSVSINFISGFDLTNSTLISFISNTATQYTFSAFDTPTLTLSHSPSKLRLVVSDIDTNWSFTDGKFALYRDGVRVRGFLSSRDEEDGEITIDLIGDVGGVYTVQLLADDTYDDSAISNSVDVLFTSLDTRNLGIYDYDGNSYFCVPTNLVQVVDGELVSYDTISVSYKPVGFDTVLTSIYTIYEDYYTINLPSNVSTGSFVNSYSMPDLVLIEQEISSFNFNAYIFPYYAFEYMNVKVYSRGYDPDLQFIPGTDIPISYLNYDFQINRHLNVNRLDRVVPSFVNNALTWSFVDNATSYNLFLDDVLLLTTELNNFVPTKLGKYTIVAVADGYLPSLPSSVYVKDFIQLATPFVQIGFRNIYFDFIPNADFYDVYYNDQFLLSTRSNIVNISFDGEYSVVARSFNVQYTDSLMSNVVDVQGIFNPSDEPYSFFNLFGALIDTPIYYLSSFLSFEVFGVNMALFLASLVSIALVIWLLKKFKGGD